MKQLICVLIKQSWNLPTDSTVFLFAKTFQKLSDILHFQAKTTLLVYLSYSNYT